VAGLGHHSHLARLRRPSEAPLRFEHPISWGEVNIGVGVTPTQDRAPQCLSCLALAARARPELDGVLLQPSNQYVSESGTIDVVSGPDQLIDLASASYSPTLTASTQGPARRDPPPVATLSDQPTRTRNLATRTAVRGDNIPGCRYYITGGLEGVVVPTNGQTIWDHFLVDGSHPADFSYDLGWQQRVTDERSQLVAGNMRGSLHRG
jgi:hypothetical protein